jgi:hypothetical protein
VELGSLIPDPEPAGTAAGWCCSDGILGTRIWVMISQVTTAKTMPAMTSVT